MATESAKFGIHRKASLLTPELVQAVEGLGYGRVWVGGSPDGDLRQIEELLDATSTLNIATGIVNIWKDAPELTAASYHRVVAKHPDRFLLGVGTGHREHTGASYTKPYQAMVDYLDGLDAGGVPVGGRVLAALGPRVLQLSADRCAGAYPYLVTPEHTRRARAILGPDALLVPEHKVVLDTDPDRARALGRPYVHQPYLGLINYTTNLRSLGYTDADLADGGSDRLIDALVYHGDASTVAEALRLHLDAGADQVAINLLTPNDADPIPGLTALAAVLLP